MKFIVNVLGHPIDVTIALGHNNDKGVYKTSGRKKDFEELNLVGLSDRGYSHHQLIRPDDLEMATKLKLSAETFSSIQAKHRAPGEIIHSFVKFFAYASERVTDTPEFQAYALITIYNLVGWKIFEKENQ
jgi:hypothetical protein